jgi:hypothetical protein
VKGSKWENRFIEDYIPRNINATLGYIKTLEAFVHIAIAQEYTSNGAKLEFMGIVWS